MRAMQAIRASSQIGMPFGPVHPVTVTRRNPQIEKALSNAIATATVRLMTLTRNSALDYN